MKMSNWMDERLAKAPSYSSSPSPAKSTGGHCLASACQRNGARVTGLDQTDPLNSTQPGRDQLRPPTGRFQFGETWPDKLQLVGRMA